MQPRSKRNPKSSFGAWGLSAIAIANLVAPVAIVVPARAAVLHSWTFDPGTRAFTFTLPNGITPKFFLMAEPARIVLEIPDTTLGAVTTTQQYHGAVSSIRLSEVAVGSRVVVELAPNTRLDPRHAELTPTTLDNGQTQWTLRPLLQDVPTAPVAATPAPAVSAPPAVPPTTVSPIEPEEMIPTAPTVAPAETTAEAPLAQADEPTAPPTDEVSAELTERTTPLDAEAETAATELPEADETAAAIPPESTEPSVPIAVTSNTDSPTVPPEAPSAQPALPDIANSVTTGAAQSLPTGPDPLAGISTDAGVLTEVQSDDLSDLPPEQLPSEPIATSRPAVSVPDLAEVPEVPVVTPIPETPTAPVARVPSNSDRPPSRPQTTAPPTAAATAPPVPSAPTSGTAVTQPPPAPEAIAATSLEVPTMPLPPENWRDRDTEIDAPSAERPTPAEAIAPPPETIAAPPPTSATTNSTAATPPTPAATASVTPPPAATAPPFLSAPPPATVPPRSQATPPVPGTEPLSIPPPPTAVSDPDTVPFGTPLPQLESQGRVAPSPTDDYRSVLPPGTRLSLQYVGATPLVIAEPEPVSEVLVVAQDVYDSETGALLLPVGTQVIGQFEQINELGRRFVTQSIVQGGDRLPLAATSGRLAGIPQPDGVEVALGSGIGAAAMTILTGFSGIGLLGGAAMGAFAGLAESPPLVTISPGTVIEVQVVTDSLPISTPPPVGSQHRQ